jgi:glucan phosphorylase
MGWQHEKPVVWEPAKHLTLLPEKVTVQIEGRNVQVQAWVYKYVSPTGGTVPILFLDTGLPENTPEDRGITDYLYGGDTAYRIKQEVVLGMGGVRMLQALEFHIKKYHMNEGTRAFSPWSCSCGSNATSRAYGTNGPSGTWSGCGISASSPRTPRWKRATTSSPTRS